MAGVQKISDEQIKKALEATGGQPTKAAKLLDVDYTTVYLRIRDSADLKAVQQAARNRTFDDLTELVLSSIKTGRIPTAIVDKDGHHVGTAYELVDPKTRLDGAAKIMNILKGDAGIVDKSEVDHTSGGKPISGVVLVD